MLDVESFLLGMAAGGGGGGNPNYVEVIEGTLANPWGEIDAGNLANEIATNNANADIAWDATAIGLGTNEAPIFTDNHAQDLFARSARIGGPNDYDALDIYWDASDGGLSSAAALTSGAGYIDLQGYASLITTTITIIYHPLP